MITTAGKNVIKQFFGGQTNQIGGAIALGTGVTAAALTDTKLAFESVRIPVSSINADLINNRIVFKSSVSPNLIVTVAEIGLYQSTVNTGKSRSINLTESPTAIWAGGTVTANTTNFSVADPNARLSNNSLLVTATTSASTDATLAIFQDLSAFASTDSVAVAFRADANLASVRVRLGSNSTNYYEFLYNAPSVGYNTMRTNVSTATTTGTPSWANINYVDIRPTAKASGATTLYFDGLRFEDNSNLGVLVARAVLSSVKRLDVSLPSDIEYSLGISV